MKYYQHDIDLKTGKYSTFEMKVGTYCFPEDKKGLIPLFYASVDCDQDVDLPMECIDGKPFADDGLLYTTNKVLTKKQIADYLKHYIEIDKADIIEMEKLVKELEEEE